MKQAVDRGRSTAVPDVIVVTPYHACDPQLAIAAARAGALGLLSLPAATSPAEAAAAISRLRHFVGNQQNWGVRVEREAITAGLSDIPWLLLAAQDQSGFPSTNDLTAGRACSNLVWAEVCSLDEALRAQECGFDGVLLKGSEAGGRVALTTSFILAQRVHGQLEIPYAIQGGVGLDSAAALRLTGACGVVLAEGLWLTRESPFESAVRDRLASCDGSEAVFTFGKGCAWNATPAARLGLGSRGGDSDDEMLSVGSDLGLAGELARRFITVGGVVAALREHVADAALDIAAAASLKPDTVFTRTHGTRCAIVQGPMTRVSDGAAFCGAVAEAGAMPMLALGLRWGEEVREAIRATADRLNGRPWGVGLLGFVDERLFEDQLEAAASVADGLGPTMAIVGGGRPGQAARLEAAGIAAYLHIPSPGLLRAFLDQGVRRFIFEGLECGGHVGPRSSFNLWQSAVDILCDESVRNPVELSVLLAGGIHDALSAAMAARVAAPLAQRGMGVGLLAGTAYLFTEEAVETGAITPLFQEQALACRHTVLVASGGGHATRCAPTPYVSTFEERRRALVEDGIEPQALRLNLERLNIGRLRLAAKGQTRGDYDVVADDADVYDVDAETQFRDGLFMMGDVAALSGGTMRLAELHDALSSGAAALLEAHARPPDIRVIREPGEPLAIIGMACRFADADDLRTYWQHIVEEHTAFRDVPPERFDAELNCTDDRTASELSYSRRGCFLGGMRFDPLVYGIPPASLRSIEPVQLFALATADEALRDAGYGSRPFPRERTATIFAVSGSNELVLGYGFRSMLRQWLARASEVDAAQREAVYRSLCERLPTWTEDSFSGILSNVVTGRISNRLNLGGANMIVDAACASSLAALYTAVQDLRSHRCDVALVGAIDAGNTPFGYLCFSRTQALSPGDEARPFDEKADGIILGEGVATIVVKRLADAERDGDRIDAVLRGIGAASDGRHRSLTAPHPGGQLMTLQRAYEDAGVDPGTVELIEAHATGTAVGDRAEINSLQRLFAGAQEAGHCAIGSVKSQIGHTKTAAGLAGIIKATCALRQHVLPPTVGVRTPNAALGEDSTALYVNGSSRPWIRRNREQPRRAGVSAFGFGGTNFHVVLEEYAGAYHAAQRVDIGARPVEVFYWERGSRAELLAVLDALALQLRRVGAAPLAHVAAAVQRAESARGADSVTDSIRLGMVADSLDGLIELMNRVRGCLTQGETAEGVVSLSDMEGVAFCEQPRLPPETVCFLFPGQGSQRVNMLDELVMGNPDAIRWWEEADALVAPDLSQPLSQTVYPVTAFTPEKREQQQAQLNDTRVAQPALAVSSLVAFDLLGAYGICPGVVAGHSFGELTALCAAGCLSREALLELAVARGRIASEANQERPGMMAVVMADPAEVTCVLKQLGGAATIAIVNAPGQTVIGGDSIAIDAAVAAFEAAGIRAKPIAVTAAFHTPLLNAAVEPLRKVFGRLEWSPPQLPVFSNTTAEAYPDAPSDCLDLLARHLVEPLTYADEIRAIHAAGARVFIECGPGQIQSGLVRRILSDADVSVLPMDDRDRPGWTGLAHQLVALAVAGLPVRLDHWFEGRGLHEYDLAGLVAAEAARASRPETWIVHPSGNRQVGEALGAVGFAQSVPQDGSSHDRDPIFSDQKPLPGITVPVLPAMVPVHGEPPALLPPRLRPQATQVASRENESETAIQKKGIGLTSFRDDLLRVLSESTGYPPAALDEDLPLESGLGIDSIKILEVFSRLKPYQAAFAAGGDPDSALATFSQLKTVRDIVNAYESVATQIDLEGNALDTLPVPPSDELIRDGFEDGIGIYRLRSREAARLRATDAVLPEGVILLCGDDTPLAQALLAGLAQRAPAHTVFHVRPGASTQQRDGSVLTCRFESARETQALRELLQASGCGPVAAIVSLLALDSPFTHPGLNGDGAPLSLSLSVLSLLRAFESDLRGHGAAGRPAVLHVTAFGNTFGIDNATEIPLPVAQAGSLGVIKAASREWPEVRLCGMDIDPSLALSEQHDSILAELFAADGGHEIGVARGKRRAIELLNVAVSPIPSSADYLVDHDGVVLVLGGASGITAALGVALAQAVSPVLILVGRSPWPDDEEADTRDCRDADELRAQLLALAREAGQAVVPADIDQAIHAILKAREMRATRAAMQAAGARVEYHAVDVSRRADFTRLVRSIYTQHGSIDGVIHGAGIIEDALIGAKQASSFKRVFNTKVNAAQVLARELKPDSLSFLHFFSSVAARFGNAGQADYCAANATLNALARELDRRWPARVCAIQWGPWNAGMPSQVQRRLLRERGTRLIEQDEGVEAFLSLLRRDYAHESELVITGALR